MKPRWWNCAIVIQHLPGRNGMKSTMSYCRQHHFCIPAAFRKPDISMTNITDLYMPAFPFSDGNYAMYTFCINPPESELVHCLADLLGYLRFYIANRGPRPLAGRNYTTTGYDDANSFDRPLVFFMITQFLRIRWRKTAWHVFKHVLWGRKWGHDDTSRSKTFRATGPQIHNDDNRRELIFVLISVVSSK